MFFYFLPLIWEENVYLHVYNQSTLIKVNNPVPSNNIVKLYIVCAHRRVWSHLSCYHWFSFQLISVLLVMPVTPVMPVMPVLVGSILDKPRPNNSYTGIISSLYACDTYCMCNFVHADVRRVKWRGGVNGADVAYGSTTKQSENST